MEAVWVFEGPDYVAVKSAAHVLPSVKLSYSGMNVTITPVLDMLTVKTFDVRKHARIGEERGELVTTLVFRLYQVYDEPTHLAASEQ